MARLAPRNARWVSQWWPSSACQGVSVGITTGPQAAGAPAQDQTCRATQAASHPRP
jgi:hypothetical protein